MTLTEFSYYSRRMLPVIIILLLVLLIFFYAIRLFLIYLEAKNPKNLNFDHAFGMTIKRPFLSDSSSPVPTKITLDTIEGQPITATETARIFAIPPTTAKFGYREKILVMAKALGFNTDLAKDNLQGIESIFADGQQKLTVDITNFNFTYEYDTQQNPSVFQNATILNPDLAQQKARDFLQAVGRYPEELARGTSKTTYYFYDAQAGHLTPSTPQSANVMEIDFYRPDVDAFPQPIPVVSPKYFTSENFVILVTNPNGLKIIKAQVKFFEKSDSQVGTYPLKTGDEAYKNLLAGHVMVASAGTGPQTTIKKMFLAYYDPDTYQEYLEPVFVFLGDNNFVGYVPAIKDTNLQ